MSEISSQHDRFCREYIVDENGTRSYMRVYPNSSYDAAKNSASELLAKPYIQERINELREQRNKRLEISADKVLQGIARLAFYDPRDLFDDDGRIKPLSELDPDAAYVLAGIETFHKVTGEDKDGLAVVTKIRLPDKGANLERLGKNLKLFTDKTELSGADGEPFKIQVVKFGDDPNPA